MSTCRTILLAASLALPAVFCLGQDTPVGTAINRLPDGSVEIQIANQHQRALTAYVLTVERTPLEAKGPHIRTTQYFDSLLNPWRDKSLAPGGKMTLRVAGPRRGTTVLQINPELKAAVFEDGMTFGDSDTLGQVIAARKKFFEELGKAILLIQNAQATQMARDQINEEAERQQKAELAGAQSPEQKRATANPFATIRVNLQRNPDVPLESEEATLLQMFLKLRQQLIQSKPAAAPPGAAVNPEP